MIINYYNKLRGKVTAFISKGHERSVKAKKNVLASFLVKGFSILVSFVLVPLTINYVNPTKYGIWLTLSSLVGWFGFFDIGFGNGLRNKLTEAIAKNQKEQARIYVSTTYFILGLIIFLILILFFVVSPFLNWAIILNAPNNMSRELGLLAIIVFVSFCLQFVLKLITTILTADQKPAKASIFNLLGSIFTLVIIYILTKITHGSLIYLGVTLSLAPVLVLLVASFWFFKNEYNYLSPSFKSIKLLYAKDLMNLGLKFFLIQISAIILYQTSNMIIAQLFGPAEVTPYNIAYKYFGIITMVFSIIMTPFWSACTDAYSKNDIAWIERSTKKYVKIWAVLAISAIILLIFSNYIYILWVGKEIKVPFSLSAILALYVVLYSWNGIFSQFLNGVGKIKLQLYTGIVGSIINIPLSIFFGKLFGIAGVTLSTCLLAIFNAVWSPLQYKKIVTGKARGIWNK